MKKNRLFKAASSIVMLALVGSSMLGCNSAAKETTAAPTTKAETTTAAQTDAATTAATEAATTAAEQTNTDPINVVWYPNESSNSHTEVRDEVARLIKQATGREVEHKLTTDYTIAIEALASGSADIAMAMGAVGYIEAKDKNPEVDVLCVNADANGTLDEAKYFSWLCVDTANAEQYMDGDNYTIDNIKGKNMSFVSNSSTSGFRVPTASIIEYFAEDALTEDDLVEGGADMFFNEVYFGQSHQGSAVNLVSGNVDVAAFCDTELAPYVELSSGEENTVGAVYKVIEGADAPFDAFAGKEFTVIAVTPVFNGPNAYNPMNLSADEIKAIQDLLTSEEVTNNEIMFYDDSVEGASGLYKKSASLGYVLTEDSWYDAYRQ